MFIKETKKNIKGISYVQHQLVESIRTNAGSRHKLILNLGRISLDKDKWKSLANRIESILNNQPLLFEEDEEVECLAIHYAKKIKQKRLEQTKIETQETEIEAEDYEEVNINSLSNSNSKSIGSEHVALSQIEIYGLENILKQLKYDDKEIKYAIMLIVGRLVHPSSERETARWINETSSLAELLNTEVNVYDNALHRTAVKLLESHNEIEAGLSESARKVFDIDESVILYDLTNTYFEGSKKGSKIAKYGGNSKEKRNDCRLVTLALTVDGEGFPKQSKVYEGNASEPGTLNEVLKELDKDKSLYTAEKTIVMDAGIASEENISLIKGTRYKYVAVSRQKKHEEDFWDQSEEEEIKLSDGVNKLKIKLEKKDGEAYLLCYSDIKQKKEAGILLRKQESFEKGLCEINEGLKKKRTIKEEGKISERIGRLKEKYKVGNLYDINLTIKDSKVTNIEYRKNAKGHMKDEGTGYYVLRTNRLDLSGEAISQIHRTLTRIEDSFRSMKGIGLRPNYHHRDDPTIAHIQITVIAYHILSGILKKLRQSGIHENWTSIKNILSTHMRETTTMNTRDKKIIDVRSCTKPTDKQYKIYKALGIKQTPLKKVKTKKFLGKCNELVINEEQKLKNVV